MKNFAVPFMVFALASSSLAHANGADARKDVNVLLFGGAYKSQRFTDNFDPNSSTRPCEVIVENDNVAAITRVTLMEKELFFGVILKRFEIHESDQQVMLGQNHDPSAGFVSIASNSNQTTVLTIQRSIRGGKKFFKFSIGVGFGLPMSCVVN